MSIVRRVLLVAAIAALAVVPLRAFGVVGSAPSSLSVSASLGGCGVAGEGIVCQIDVSFTGVEDADYYTASVTRADGSVQDLGTVGSGEGGGSASVSVPYVGAGNYSVTVSAWGSADDEERSPSCSTARSPTRRSGRARGRSRPSRPRPSEEPSAENGAQFAPAEEPAEPEPAETAPAEPPTQSLPECRPDAAAAAPEAPMDGEAPAEAERAAGAAAGAGRRMHDALDGRERALLSAGRVARPPPRATRPPAARPRRPRSR